MIKEKDGFKYSLKAFEGYEFRAKFVITLDNGEQVVNTDIYTSNTSRIGSELALLNTTHKKYTSISVAHTGIIYWASAEQDQQTSELLDSLLDF